MTTQTYAQQALDLTDFPEGWVKHEDENREGPFAESPMGARLYPTNWNDGTFRVIDDEGVEQGEMTYADAIWFVEDRHEDAWNREQEPRA